MRTPLSRFRLLVVCLLWAACSGGGSCGGCSCLTPLPNGYQGTRLEGSMGTRVTQAGFDFINTNYATLLPSAGVTNPMAVPVACTGISFGSSGHFCDQNRNDQCDPGEGCNVSVNIMSLRIEPNDGGTNTGVLNASASLQIKTGDMWVRTCAQEVCVFGACACLCRLTCAANFDSTRAGAPEEQFSADVNFSIDATYGKLLAFNVVNINGINTLDSNDLNINTSGFCSALACGFLDIGFIKTYVVDSFVKPALQTQITSAVDGARCRSCGTGQPACPGASTCQSGRCVDPGGSCVPTLMGVEGRLDLSTALAGMGAPPGRAINVLAAAGGTVSSQAGSNFTVGLIGGAQPEKIDPCVPALPALPVATIPSPDWDAGAPGYHVGIAVAGRFLNEAGWAAEQAGGLCLAPTHADISFLETGLLGIPMPSLGLIANRDGHTAPMMLVMRPHTAPSFVLGSGAVDPVTHQPTDPLITMTLKNLSLDFYAQIDDRYARVFTLETDVVLPLSLTPKGCTQLVPAVGDLTKLITVNSVSNNDILAEDDAVLKGLVGVALQVAGPSLTNALGGLTLPTLGGFQLEVNDVKGITPQTGGGFAHIGLFATLLQPGATCPVPKFKAKLSGVELKVPSGKQWREAKGDLQAEAWVTVDPASVPAGAELSWRVDGSLWSNFALREGDRLHVVAPLLMLQGTHVIEVRAREREQLWAVTDPVQVSVVVDTEAPGAVFQRTPSGTLAVVAHDAVTPEAELEMAVRVGAGAFSAFGPLREVSADEAEQGIEVQVRDRVGNVATLRSGPVAQARQALDGAPPAPAQGCSAVGGLGALLSLMALGLRRRKR
jgi:hypothetical protein